VFQKETSQMRAGLLFLLIFACVSPASAHVGLAVTVPDHDAVLEQAPTLIHFQFMAMMTLMNLKLEAMTEAGPGARIDIRLPRNSIGQSTAFGENIDIALPELAPATYKVTWHAVSVNGDYLIDDFSFTVSEAK
jgi:methionine-rich copper-binding protein CopC